MRKRKGCGREDLQKRKLPGPSASEVTTLMALYKSVYYYYYYYYYYNAQQCICTGTIGQYKAPSGNLPLENSWRWK